LSTKNIAISAVIVVSIITVVTLLVETRLTFQSINPVAMIAALTVTGLGLRWFRKIAKH
jgi:uncharacterized membrane protein